MERIQHYEVIKILGSGGFGVVVEAVDPEHPERPVAIKLLHRDLAQIDEVAQRFFQEAIVLAKLEHPLIPRIFSFGPWNDSYFLVQELIRGEPLSRVFSRAPATIPEALEILRALLDVMAYAHGRGVIHRDLKPENVVKTDQGIRVLDFGLAKILGGVRLTRGEGFLGSVPYAAPEQLRGEEVDERADIFSLGILLHALLTGGPPHLPSATTLSAALDAQLAWAEKDPRGSLRALRPDVPDFLDRFYRTATAPLPEHRYRDAALARAALLGEAGPASTGSPGGGPASTGSPGGGPGPEPAPAQGGLQVRIEPRFDRLGYPEGDDPLVRFLVSLEIDKLEGASPPAVTADIFLVLDVSGSMDTVDKYPLLRRAMEELLLKMAPDDRVGVVVFSTNADLITPLIPGRHASREVTALLSRMDASRLKFGGATHLAPGLRVASEALGQRPLDRAEGQESSVQRLWRYASEALGKPPREKAAAPRAGVQRVYVLTDGELHDTGACEGVLSGFRRQGLEVHIYGFGTGFNAAALRHLVSDQLGGSVKPICNEQDIINTFAHIADVNRRLVAQEGLLTVEFDAEVDCGDAWNFRPQERYLGPVRGRRVVRELGGVETGRTYSMLFEARLPPVADGSSHRSSTPVARVKLTCKQGDTRVEHTTLLSAPRLPAGSAGAQEPVADVEQAYQILDAQRRTGDKEAELAAVKARLALATREGRDPGLLAALKKQLDVLEGRVPAERLNQADQQYLRADEISMVFSLSELTGKND